MIEPNKVVVEPARATVEMEFTRNLGNFENLKVRVGLSASANQDEKAVQLFERVYSFVESRLMEKFADTERELREAADGS